MDKVSKYEAAREWLHFLIDHPDKTVSVREYREMLDAAQSDRDASYAAMRAVRHG